MEDTNQEENADPRKDCVCWWEGLKVKLEQEFFTKNHLDTH
jgi:hypothetical protein